MQPVRALHVDAAIIFADIVLLFPPMGFSVGMREGQGPVIGNPIRRRKDVERIVRPRREDFSFLSQSVSLASERARKEERVPLIGFSGAPFTLAVFLVDGSAKKDAARTKLFLKNHPDLWHALMEEITDSVILYLSVQKDAGALALALFDSFVGCLSAEEYERFALPYSNKIFKTLREWDIPAIHYGAGAMPFLPQFSRAPSHVVSVDSEANLPEAFNAIGEKSLQGNLNPALLLADFGSIRREIDRIFREIEAVPGARRRYIFNTGGGILPHTPLDTLKRVVQYVHER